MKISAWSYSTSLWWVPSDCNYGIAMMASKSKVIIHHTQLAAHRKCQVAYKHSCYIRVRERNFLSTLFNMLLKWKAVMAYVINVVHINLHKTTFLNPKPWIKIINKLLNNCRDVPQNIGRYDSRLCLASIFF